MNKESSLPARTSTQPHGLRMHATAVVVLGALTLGIFADVLLDSRPTLIGAEWTDMYKQFAYWRQFGFTELSKGNLALWNPYIFCGSPYFGGMQSALLYPPNWLFMVLPLVTALNLSFALHLWLTGVFMYAWAFRRGLGRIAATVTGAVLMLSGAVFMQLMPGHLPHLCTMAWAPLVLLVVDSLMDKPSLGWVLLGTLAVAMQVLAGHPQYFFYTAVAASVYAVLNLLVARRRLLSLGGIVAMFVAAGAISAVQLLTTVNEAPETLRSGLTLQEAGQYSFCPENFMCFLAPAFFGGAAKMNYWGRWFLWEVQPFIGVAGLFLACYGALAGAAEKRRFSILMVVLMGVLAMGVYIPFAFRLTHDYLPLFDRFRNSCRFLYPATLFLAMLCGIGLHVLVSQRRFYLGSAVIALIAAIVLALTGWAMHTWASAPAGHNIWADLLLAMGQTGESWLYKGAFTDKIFIGQAGEFAARSVLIAAATAGVLSLLLILVRLLPRAGYLVALLALTEMFFFDRFTQRPTFQFGAGTPEALEQYVCPRGDDSRTLDPFLPNLAMAIGGADLWGYDSFVLRRYMEFVYFTQDRSPQEASYHQHLGFLHPHRLFSMLRCRSVLTPQGIVSMEPMAYLHLVGRYQVGWNRDAIFEAMSSPAFDPTQTVFLEEDPPIAPAGVSAAGWAKVSESSTDSMTIEAELSVPAILLITDAYSEHWGAFPLSGSSQSRYTIMPANYCLRAVPLAAGRHRFRLDYQPRGFLIGKWVSGAAVAVYLVAVVAALVWGRRAQRAAEAASRPTVTYVNPRRPPGLVGR